MSTEITATDWDTTKVIELPLPKLAETNTLKPPPIVRRLMDLLPANPDDKNTLLGNRFLCRGGGVLFIGHAGIGKSTAVIQAAMCWSIGRVCFGIKPADPLKILYIQAENDEGDLCEMRDGVLRNLDELLPIERPLLDNFVCATESSRTGDDFITEVLQPLLEEHSPDLLILDPAFSYIGCDASDQKSISRFLRNQLTPLLQEHECGAFVVHHTPKPSNQSDQKKKLSTDLAYAGAGSAEWANWARGVLVFRAKNDDGVRELHIGKRFRLGWKDAAGKPMHFRLLRQNVEGGDLFYTELSEGETIVMNQKLSPLQRVLRSHSILPESGQTVSQQVLIARITGADGSVQICGRDKARDEVIPLLVEEKYLVRKEIPRAGRRAEIQFERTVKEPNVIDLRVNTEAVNTGHAGS